MASFNHSQAQPTTLLASPFPQFSPKKRPFSSGSHSDLVNLDYISDSAPSSAVPPMTSSPIQYSGDNHSNWDTNQSSPDTMINSSVVKPITLNKRRKTSNDDDTPYINIAAAQEPRSRTSSESKETYSPTGSGKGGMDVWPALVEDAFYEALALIPKLGRKKILVGSKRCGRNELVADYILRKTGKERSRKQVSSHIQVLKNIRKNDSGFMSLVREPLEGSEDFAEGHEALFFFDSPRFRDLQPVANSQDSIDKITTSPIVTIRRLPSQPRRKATAPQAPKRVKVKTERERGSTPSPPALIIPGVDRPMVQRYVENCPIAPAAFTIWSANPMTNVAQEIFANLESRDSIPADVTYLEGCKGWETKFSKVPDMYDHLPCPFLHVKINLDIPSTTTDVEGKDLLKINTSMKLSSVSDEPLTSVTTIYSYGQKILSLVDQLPKPALLGPTTSRLHMDAYSHGVHAYLYTAPFAADFWSIFLRGVFETGNAEPNTELPQMKKNSTKTAFNSYSKFGNERIDFGTAIEGVSVIQEFVLPSPAATGSNLSPGSELGSVVLVVIYELECSDLALPTTNLSMMNKSVKMTMLKMEPEVKASRISPPLGSITLDQDPIESLLLQPVNLAAPSPRSARSGLLPSPLLDGRQVAPRPSLAVRIPASKSHSFQSTTQKPQQSFIYAPPKKVVFYQNGFHSSQRNNEAVSPLINYNRPFPHSAPPLNRSATYHGFQATPATYDQDEWDQYRIGHPAPMTEKERWEDEHLLSSSAESTPMVSSHSNQSFSSDGSSIATDVCTQQWDIRGFAVRQQPQPIVEPVYYNLQAPTAVKPVVSAKSVQNYFDSLLGTSSRYSSSIPGLI